VPDKLFGVVTKIGLDNRRIVVQFPAVVRNVRTSHYFAYHTHWK